MLFSPTSLQELVVIDLERREDERGYFARTTCQEEFKNHGLKYEFVQTNHSHNKVRGTFHGMHFQRAPHSEIKLIRCIRGAVYDVAVDLRPQSPTFRRWEAFELTDTNGRSLYIPDGFAHGYITLMDNTDVIYHVSHRYTPQAAGGFRYDDPAISINWPIPVKVISEQDMAWPLLTAT
jgi:dTDP-4-dehydrorhamnose 3,5-epimerase